MKHIAIILWVPLIIFFVGLSGCSKPASELVYCSFGVEDACADVRESYKAIKEKAARS